MKKILLHFIILTLLLLPSSLLAQYYFPQLRPAGLDWQEIKTEHFRIIFPDGEDSLAFRSAEILESQYESVQELTGGTLKNFPVILRNYNDISNGFVTTLNFRSEVDLSPIKGKELNPVTGGWLENVLPHELVHAAHFNVQQDKSEQKISLPNLISYLSPDMARSFHGFVPVGFHEGLAVHHESNAVFPKGGRANFTYFTNRFNANFASPDRWNMGQTLISSDYSLPNNRHYIAGSTFVDWLHENYGEDFSKEAIRFHYHHFMFGFGYTLKRKTGKWPGQLFALYEEDLEEKEEKRLDSIQNNTTRESRIIETPFNGEQLRGPIWIDNKTLLFYGAFYNAKLGFYTYDLESGDLELLKEIFTVSDYNYELVGNELIFSSYKGNEIYPGVYQADIQKLNLKSRKVDDLTSHARVYAPTISNGRIFGIQAHGSTGKIVEVLKDSIRVVKEFQDATPIHLKTNPVNANEIAVVLNRRGVQGLWLTTVDEMASDLDRNPDIAFKNGSIHDPEWHPDGSKVLFSMDAHPAMNIYELDINSGSIKRLTSSIYNAFEAIYSPKADAIAYVVQQSDERRIAILQKEDFVNGPVPDSLMLNDEELNNRSNQKLVGEGFLSEVEFEKKPYKPSLEWLKPRLFVPVVEEVSGTYEYGVGFSSIDALQSQSYYAQITGIQNRLWYDLSYTNKTFYPGFNINVYSEPVFFATVDPTTEEQMAIMRQDRGLSLSFPFDYTFRNNTRYSSFIIEPEISAEQFKYHDLAPTAISDFATRYKAGFYSQLYLNVMRLPRDVQPSSGLALFALLERTLNEPSVDITFAEGTGTTTFNNQWSAYYGTFFYVAPLQRWNQSLRIDLRFLQQSTSPIYSNKTIVPMGFKRDPFPNRIEDTVFNNIARFSTRYTVPLLFPDTGGLTLPLYLSSIYLTGFSHTLTNLNSNDLLASSRSIFGAGLHVQLKLSNVLFDFGFGAAFEPSRSNAQFIFGQF